MALKVQFYSCSFAMSLLFYCWPTVISSATNVSSTCLTSNTDWIKTPIPLYYVIGLATLLLVTLATCIVCLKCARQRRNQEFIKEPEQVERIASKEEPNDNKPTSSIANSCQDINHSLEEHMDDTKEQRASNKEETGCLKENDTKGKHTVSTPSCEEKPNESHIETPVWKPREDQDLQSKPTSDNDHALPRREPLYAEVNKNKKEKEKNPNTVVYAELADFTHDNNHETQGLRQNTDYAEITRLAKSPRDMSPLEDC